MSSAALSKGTDRVKSPVENSDSKSDCEVSSSSKVTDSKIVHSSIETTKENTVVTTVPTKLLSSHDNTKLDIDRKQNEFGVNK